MAETQSNALNSPLRTRLAIDQEYSECAMKLGDTIYKIKAIYDHIKKLRSIVIDLKVKMETLSNEPAEAAKS